MTVRTITPWYQIRRRVPARHSDRLFDEFRGFGLRPVSEFGLQFSPKVNVSETETAIKIAAELPGLDENDIDVSLEKNVLTISGEKQAEHKDEGEHYRYIERSYGSFKRSVALPVDVEVDQIEASFKNGVLTVVLPKSAEAQAKKIEVKTG